MKKYVKPEMGDFEMAASNILAGSINVKGKKIGVSSFFTDESDWKELDNGKSGYSFWD